MKEGYNMGRKPRDFSQIKVGRLQPLYIDESKPRGKGQNIYWICQCDCGNIVSWSTCNLQAALKANRDSSCGCVSRIKNLVEQRFGNLVVISLNKELSSNPAKGWKSYWNCRCDCGNLTTVLGSNLTSNHTSSCGCINYSIGEQNIEDILKQNNIRFVKEYSFSDLFDKQEKNKLRFDFAILDENNNVIRLIEFDGRQHYNPETPWDSIDTLESRQHRDSLKNLYCLTNNIPLVRIPYNLRDKLTLQILLLDTTYLIKGIQE